MLVVGVDANIVIRGIETPWGSAKGLLVLATRRRFELLLVQPVEDEARRTLARNSGGAERLDQLLRRCRVRRAQTPTSMQWMQEGI